MPVPTQEELLANNPYDAPQEELPVDTSGKNIFKRTWYQYNLYDSSKDPEFIATGYSVKELQDNRIKLKMVVTGITQNSILGGTENIDLSKEYFISPFGHFDTRGDFIPEHDDAKFIEYNTDPTYFQLYSTRRGYDWSYIPEDEWDEPDRFLGGLVLTVSPRYMDQFFVAPGSEIAKPNGIGVFYYKKYITIDEALDEAIRTGKTVVREYIELVELYKPAILGDVLPEPRKIVVEFNPDKTIIIDGFMKLTINAEKYDGVPELGYAFKMDDEFLDFTQPAEFVEGSFENHPPSLRTQLFWNAEHPKDEIKDPIPNLVYYAEDFSPFSSKWVYREDTDVWEQLLPPPYRFHFFIDYLNKRDSIAYRKFFYTILPRWKTFDDAVKSLRNIVFTKALVAERETVFVYKINKSSALVASDGPFNMEPGNVLDGNLFNVYTNSILFLNKNESNLVIYVTTNAPTKTGDLTEHVESGRNTGAHCIEGVQHTIGYSRLAKLFEFKDHLESNTSLEFSDAVLVNHPNVNKRPITSDGYATE